MKPLKYVLSIALISISLSALTDENEGQALPDPTELVALRNQYHVRFETDIKPARERLIRDLESTIQRLLLSQRGSEALIVQRFLDAFRRTGEPASLPNNTPTDLIVHFSTYKNQYEELKRAHNANYIRQLSSLQKLYAQQGNLSAAMAVAAEIERLNTPMIFMGKIEKFEWLKIKEVVKYTYQPLRFDSGGSNYEDKGLTKLLDGKYNSTFSSNSIGWLTRKPSNITVDFGKPVKPKALRLFVHGGGYGAVNVPKRIRVLDVTDAAQVKVIGEISEPEDKTNWLEIPLQIERYVLRILIDMERSSGRWVIIDEMEFR